ncbi:efflux RND transporter permease subunit [Tautonia sociabilis]|uniref:Efflux RND transporter permease subunit n=1 Tax=Tautonia sociabilis TaxID=2080755 RepID=A0A432ME98_9BACT|nr:efflux RND transporter permease subunit [Tautonia sociabilis]RUL83571.1 efflux RND transporter permease subunit [Tautonia sociabilis]
MIESIIEWSIRNRLLVILAAIALGLAGVRAAMTMPVDAIPDLSENQVIVFTDWPGRSPQEIEDQVTYPLSVNLQGLAGVKVVRSSSEFNFSMINIIFDDETDYYFARTRVLERLSIASTFLPEGVTPYLAPDATAVGQIFWYTVEGEGKDLDELRSIQDWYVRYQLNSVPGVAEVASVGGAPREYQVDLDPNKLRAYGITLGEVYSAVSRANSAVGGRVIHQGNAEYLIRSVGWIRSLDDLKGTVVAQREGTPIRLKDLGVVQMGQQFRRSVLEKDGREAVGGVVLMRFGENPLEVTRRIKEKITTLQAGLPEGVRIVPFYDRTPLIHGAIETVSDTVKEELFICTMMILLIMGHLGGAFVVSLTLPLAVLFSVLMMRLMGIPSNIMSLAGIAISVGILEDQAVVMTENAAHHLTRRHGNRRITGSNLDVIIPACRTVGRPIFFSILITILSFLPVFALSGMEGKMFHPLAWTKTFALIGVAILAVTLVPALIPIFLRGRIKSEEDSWLVRTMISIFKPMLSWLMDRPTLVCWLLAVIVGFGYLASTRVGREFMPPLNEGSILDMPTSVPRTSVTQAADDLKARDAILRTFPEVWQVVGKAGRAETSTDPAPLDMVETIINLRDRELWPKRQLRYEDAVGQTAAVLAALEAEGHVRRPPPADDRESLINDAAMTVASRVDRELRELAHLRLAEFRPELGRALVEGAVENLLGRVAPDAVERAMTPAEREDLLDALAGTYGDRLALVILPDDVTALVRDAARRLVALGVLEDDPGLLAPPPSTLERAGEALGEALGLEKPTLFSRIADDLAASHAERMEERTRTLNWELFDRAVAVATATAAEELVKLAGERELAGREATAAELESLTTGLEESFSRHVFLWQKTKDDLVKEMDTAIQMPGWGNIWTQPIINRIDMLATGVRTQIGVKVFGDDLDEIQRASQEIAAVLKRVRGAVDVFPDQIVGKGYVEIEIDREKAARYGIQVGDVQDVVEVAMGGKPLTMTVEGRERYPVRVRYARDFRDDVKSLRQILVGARGPASGAGMGEPAAAAMSGAPGAGADAAPPVQVPLSQVADIRVVEGPSVIKSENGLLRAYVQLNVRDRDVVGFVEEARRAVEEQVELPEGMYVEWAGQFEHQVRARKTLQVVFPAVVAVIVLLLYLTYKSWVDATLILPSILGALAGGAIFQWLFGFNFSVAVWVGYIACFGMATETGIVMMVYLREAIRERGGLAGIRSVAELREAILEGAIHRLRPKLLTEGTTIIAIAPMLWADGVGAEMIRPMAAPVLGGLLVADEVVDIFLPVLYFAVQKWRWRRAHGLGPLDERVALAAAEDPVPVS